MFRSASPALKLVCTSIIIALMVSAVLALSTGGIFCDEQPVSAPARTAISAASRQRILSMLVLPLSWPRRLIPQQLVDRRLGAGTLVDGLHDHRAVGRRQARVVGVWPGAGHDD